MGHAWRTGGDYRLAVFGVGAAGGASILAITLLLRADSETVKTLALCNANRYVGLALLITRQYTNARHAVPAIACYALVAPLIMLIYARLVRRRAALKAVA